jgi:predicted nucleic acid-binding protein
MTLRAARWMAGCAWSSTVRSRLTPCSLAYRPRTEPAVVVVREFLVARFPQPFLRLSPSAYRTFLLTLPDLAVSGGAAYDALVAATAVDHGAALVSCDRRAALIYERYRVRTQLL